MKTLYDYVKEHGRIVETEIVTPFDAPNLEILVRTIGSKLRIYDGDLNVIAKDEDDLAEYLYTNYNMEIKFCDRCGCIMQSGYTDDDGDFCNCENCFEEDMNERYGKGNWRALQEENDLGGYYEYRDENGNWNAEPSYYTEWY